MFINKCNELVNTGEIEKSSLDDCMYALFDDDKKKQINDIEKDAMIKAKNEIKANKSPYSKEVDGEKMENLIDRILHDKPVHMNNEKESEPDPCFCGSHSRISSC